MVQGKTTQSLSISKETIHQLEETAKQVRLHIVKMIHKAQSGHPGGSAKPAALSTSLQQPRISVRKAMGSCLHQSAGPRSDPV